LHARTGFVFFLLLLLYPLPSPLITPKGLKRFGQLLSVGKFPAHLKPFVFNWPNGTALTYFSALQDSAKAEFISEDLLEYVREEIKKGGQGRGGTRKDGPRMGSRRNEP
jgi:hypothetical protein